MPQHDPSVPGQHGTVACDPGGKHAVKHVDAGGHGVKNVVRSTYSHEVMRNVGGKQRSRLRKRFTEEIAVLANGEPSDCYARQTEGGNLFHTPGAEVGKEIALGYPEQQPVVALVPASLPLLSGP